jgi:hypothetical protein
MPGCKGERREITESYEHLKEEIDACLRCRLPDCRPAAIDCNLRRLREQKLGRRIKLK